MKHVAFLSSILLLVGGPANAQLSGWGSVVAPQRSSEGHCNSDACKCFADLGHLTRRLADIYLTPIDSNGRYYGTPEQLRRAEIAAQNIFVAQDTAYDQCKKVGREAWVPQVPKAMNNMRFLE